MLNALKSKEKKEKKGRRMETSKGVRRYLNDVMLRMKFLRTM